MQVRFGAIRGFDPARARGIMAGGADARHRRKAIIA
jgi:hypothetical protein